MSVPRLLCLVTTLLALCRTGRAVECKLINNEPCQCSFTDDGKAYFIDITDYFTYPTTPTPDSDQYTYEFSCRNFDCSQTPHPNAVACQYIKKQKVDTGLGRVNKNTTWEINALSDDNFQFVVTYHNGEGQRTTQVKFTYGSGDMKMKVKSGENKLYKMEVTGNKVKKSGGSGPTSNPTSPNKGKGGGGGTIAGPIGIVIILLFIGGFVTYFIVGGIYMYRVKGARGLEVIPNAAFWKALPLLIKDGFLFTISPCYKRNEYQKL